MDPVKLEINPEPKQYEAWCALQNPNIKDIYFGGGAGGGKSWLGCESRLARAISMPGYKSFIARNELTRLMKSAYVTWTKVCKWHHIDPDDWKLNSKYNYIDMRNGSRIDLLDVSHQPSDPMYERFGSSEYTDSGWFEEAGEMVFMAVDILRSRGGRHMNQEFGNFIPDSLCTFNPNKGWVYRIYKLWKDGLLPADAVFIQSLFGDNSYTKEIYGAQLKRIQDTAMRARLMLGSFEYDSDPTSLIDYDAIVDIFTNTLSSEQKEGKDEKALTGDIARHGVDKTVFYIWRGWTIVGVRIYAKQDTAVTSVKARDLMRDKEISYSRSVFDEDGIGGSVVDQNKGVIGFVANSTPRINPQTKEPENYANLKAQCSYKLAEKVNAHQFAVKIQPGEFISEVPGITFEVWKDMLTEELDHIKSKNKDRDQKLRVVDKETTKEALGRSPDFADTAMMRSILEYPSVVQSRRVTVTRPKNPGGFSSIYRRPGQNF